MIKDKDLINLLPSISSDDGIPTLSFDSMPYWEGVQKTPGIRRTLPFSLTATIGSPIRQIASEDVITDVVNAYMSDEYSFITPPPGASEWANSLGETYVGHVKNVIKRNLPKNILEIGGGSTWIASRLREHYKPISYVIVDPSVRDSAEGVKVILDYFPNHQLADCYFDLVLGFNVLEHIPDPLSFLRSIRKQLATNAKVILIYPDCERQLLQGDLNVLLHEHLSYFTEASSRWLALAAGFNVLTLSTENDTLTVVLEASSGNSNSRQKLDEFQLINSCAKSFKNALTVTADKIRGHLNNNQSVAFHGATNGLNTFLFITGLGGHSNIHVYDGDESKQGLYLPACSTPIISPKNKSYADNSLLVISAASFYKQIMNFAEEKSGFHSSQILLLAGC